MSDEITMGLRGLKCDCGNNMFFRFGPYPTPEEKGKLEDGLRWIYTCTVCADQLGIYQRSKMLKVADR